MIVDFPDDFLPLVIPTKGGTTQAVRIVLANSREDKELLEVTRVFFFFVGSSLGFTSGIILDLHCRESFIVLKRRRARKFVDFER
jgi:hypothetical protein